ncbi:SRPBCC family protein [Kitasatospora cineracea]|uniref:Putative membrane protein n=1 Tax=Kitasatospora cineracea TaxID=88074 RepID=A0A8G1ULI5_9ACTN|nr:SRPBCC family protein [Kitasatospora cineracea]ROR46270.1 putative membrane protein [Kitasatospora cineracea]
MARRSDDGGAGAGGVLDALPTEQLMDQTRELVSALGERVAAAASDKLGAVTERLVDYVANGGSSNDSDGGGGGGGGSMAKTLLGAGASGLKQAVTGKLGGGGGGGGGGNKETKVINIVEQIDVGVPVRVAYNQWTQFQDFPKYTKRVEQVDQSSDEKLSWKAGIFLSHRTWESTIVEQVPDERIVWRSKGAKGSADGVVTFHELTPNLTRILLVLEYHPQGLFERTGNLWRAQGRRARLELKHFRRHVMTRTILDPDSVEGWRGEIRDSEVVRSHEDAVKEEEEQQDQDEQDQDEQDQDEPDQDEPDEDGYDEDAEDGYEEDEGEPDDEGYDESDGEEEYEDEGDEDEPDDEDATEDDDEEEEESEEPERPARRGSRRTSSRKR